MTGEEGARGRESSEDGERRGTSLSEARPSMVKRVDGWTAAVVRGCLEGMGELSEDDMDIWLEADVSANNSLPISSLVTGSTDALSAACGGPHG